MNIFFSDFVFVDLTHQLDEGVPTWEGESGFRYNISMDYEDGARVIDYYMCAGIGTHIDAPAHFFKDKATVGDLKIEDFFVSAYVLDISNKVESKFDYMISIKDLQEFESRYGNIEQKGVFLAYTGWSNRWPDAKKYRNVDSQGKMRFPGFSPESADYLLNKNVVGIGIDTLSPDGANYEFPVHKKILGCNKYILENIANLGIMPPVGSYIVTLPLKIKNGTESPVRVIGFIPKK